MIHIKANRKYFKLHAEGHAGFGIQGTDVVCAAASALVLTYASVAENMDENGLTWKKSSIKIDEAGTADIRIYPRKKYEFGCMMKLDTVLEGLFQLAAAFPDNVGIEGYIR